MLGSIVKVLLVTLGMVLRAKDMLENRFHRFFRKGIYAIRRKPIRRNIIKERISGDGISGMLHNEI